MRVMVDTLWEDRWLEIARTFSLGPAPRNDAVFLITGAEERALCDAQASAAEYP